ncbi:MAG: glycerol-3-phosphate acyltransferase, partial [Chloroflexi bacterium]|nr:glycerol-3-phosphate acyltransferase [Chloroflexota bacterium]
MGNVLWIIAGYLLGSIPTAYLAGRWLKGIDLRE